VAASSNRKQATGRHLDVSALESWLWEAACVIRGPLDAPKFKDYILPLVFLERLSDEQAQMQRRTAVSLSEVVIEGTLKPDGTLELDQKPSLSPGRVKVILQSAPAGMPPQRGLAQVIDEIHQGQLARGFQGRSAEEIQAGLQEGEAEYERKMQALRSPT
jgi:hypothetical protein